MPRVEKQKAAKDYPDQGIQKGDTYFKWSFRYGGTHKSKTYPRPSQLTQSKHSTVYAALEIVQDLCADAQATIEDIVEALSSGAEDVRGVGEEYMEADEAMGGNQGVNCERSEACEDLAGQMEELSDQFSEVSCGPDEEYTDLDDALGALTSECGSLDYNEV